MEVMVRWSWTVGLAGAVLVVGAVSGFWLTGSMDGPPTWLALSGGILLVGYALVDRERLGGTVATRGFAYGTGSTLLVALAGGLAVASFALAHRNDHTWDLTRRGSYTLSDQAARVASSLEVDVSVTAWFRGSAAGRKPFLDLIRRFEEASGRIHVEFLDPLQEPLKAQEAGITGDHGTVIMTAGDRTERLDWEITEDELVRALVLLQSGETHRVCWSVGHGEPDPDDEFSEDGLGGIRSELERLNYQVTKQAIAQVGVDGACEVLVVARPTVDPFPYEREAIAAYLAEGGRVVMLLEPRETPELSRELERYGVQVGDDVVIDLNLKNQLMGVADPSMVVLSAEDFATHPITRNLTAAVVLRIARSVRAMHDVEGIDARDLLVTSPDAWGETDPGADEVQPDAGLEVIGEVPVMVVSEIEDPAVIGVATPSPDAEADPLDLTGDPGRAVPADFTPKPGGRLVVVGDSDFASNTFLAWGNNRDLFLNTIAWLVEEEDQIGERPEAGDTLEISVLGEGLLCLISVVFVPGAAVAVALGTLLRRRYL